MKRAINPETGEVVFLVNNEWVSPSKTAVNEAGDKAFLVNNQWYVPPVVVETEPILTPEERMTAPAGADTTGGIQASDYGKLFGAGAVKSTLGAPEAIQAGASGIARDTATKPTDILNYLADPRKLANDFASAIRLPKIFEDDAKLGIVPKKTAEKQKLAIDKALTEGKLQSLRDLTAYGSRVAERIEDSVTPEMKQALADSQPTGNIIEALETGDFSKISLGKDPSLAGIAGQAAKVFGSTAPAILTAVVTKSPVVGGVAGFGQAGSEGVEAAREHIKSMSNEELAEKSEYFRNLLALGYKPDLARKMTEDKAGDTAAYYQGMVGALGNQFTANLIKGKFDDVLLANAKSRLSKIVKGTAAGMTEEGLQELAEGIATDLGIDRTVVREMGVDSFANVVLGAIGGGAPGGIRGAISKDKTAPEAKPTDTTEVAPSVTPVTVEETPVATAPAVTPAAVTPPSAPVSGAIAAEEIETAETAPPVTPPAAPAVAPAPVAEAPASPELAKLKQEFDDLNAKLASGQVPADQFSEVNDRLADLQAAMAEVKAGKTTTAVPSEAQKSLDDFLSQDKDETIKKISEGNGVDLDYAAKAYEAEKEFREAKAKYYTPELINSPEFKAAQKKHTVFFNKLRQASQRAAAKPVATEVLKEDEVKATPARIVPTEENQDLPEGRDTSFKEGYEPVVNPTIQEKKAIDIYKAIKESNPDADVDEEIVNPNRYHLIQELPNAKGVKIGDKLYEKGNPNPLTAVTVNEKSVKLVDENGNAGFKDYDQISKTPIDYDYTFDLPEGKVQVNYTPMAGNVHFDLYGPGVDSSTGYRSVFLGLTEKPLTQKEIDDFAKQVVEQHKKKPEKEKKKPTKAETAEYNRQRIAKNKAAVKELAVKMLKDRLSSDTLVNVVSTDDGENWSATGSNERDERFLVPLDLTKEETATAKELEQKIFDAKGNKEKDEATKALREFLTPAAQKAAGMKVKEPKKPAQTKEEKAEANRKRQEEKKAKAAEEKKSAKEKEKEETARVVKAMQDEQAQKNEAAADRNARIKELEAMPSVAKETPETYQKADLKELQEAIDEVTATYRTASRKYINTGEGRAEVVKATDELNKATEAYNKAVLEGIQEEEAPKAEVKGEEKVRITSPTEKELVDSLSKYLGGSNIRVEGENVYNAKGLIPYYKVRKKGGRYQLVETITPKTKVKEKPALEVSGTDLIKSQSKSISFQEMAKVGPKIDNIRYAQDGKIAFTFNGQEFLIKEPQDVLLVGSDKDMARKWIAKSYGFLLEPFASKKEVHVEGNQSEPVTTKTIEEAIDKAETKVDKKQIKKSINEQFDKAIKEAKYPDDAAWKKSKGTDDQFVIIDIPGDGKFRVKNNAERLKELQKRLIAALPLKGGKPARKPSAASVTAPEKVLADMINDGEMDNALEYAKINKIVPTYAGLTTAGRDNLDKMYGDEKQKLRIQAEIEGKSTENIETYQEAMDRINAKMKEEGRESEYEKAAKELAATKAKIAELQAKEKQPRAKGMSEEEVFGEELPAEKPKSQEEINRERQEAKKRTATGDDKDVFFGNFTGDITPSELDAMNEEVRDEKILELAKISRKITTLTKKISQVGGDIQIQKNLNYLLGKQADLRNEIDATKGERRSADWFRARAAEELAKGNISPETMAVVDELYRKYPSFLEGLKLSVREGKRAGVEGSFSPITRLVSIFKNPFSITQDETMRHEIMHSLEQMMTPEAQKALVSAWSSALSKAIEKHKDPASQEFFNAVLDYVENPTAANYRRATNKMPSIRFYQYMNPSEFWAVNGEKLMKSQLGSPWARFVKGVQKILEAMKNVFGFDNRYSVHREFDRLMKGESGQMTDKMLADYLRDGDIEIEFLNQVEEVDELLEKHERPTAPLHPSDKLKDRLLQKTESITELFDQYKENPRLETSKMIGGADRAITYARNKNVWFGTGLELADLKRYNGQLRDDKGFAVASIALTNAVHAGHVGTQVITHGGLRFDPVTQQFTAYDSKYSLGNVVREKTKLIAKLGEQRAADVIQAFFEAKRSRSIQNEFYDRQAEFENLKAEFESEVDPERKDELYKEMMSAEEDLRRVMVALDKVNMTDEAIDDFIALEKKYPELKEMMRNWTAVNQNMIDNMEFSGIISKKRAERLRAIKDYVPWYRIQDDMADPHDRPAQGVRGLTNVAGEKKFKKGQTDKDIDDIVDNMIHNVMMTTRNSIRNYAANRIAQQYATRNDKDKIKVFPQEGKTVDGAIRVNILANGRRIVVEIKDPLIAEAVLGMESIEIPMINALAVMANGLRRGITSFPIFQVKQLFMDAPTAAWVSGVKNPFKVWGDTFASFIAALNPNDPIVKMMKNYGIGGYQSSARTPEKELKMQIGLIGRSPFAYLLKTLDHIGDASDYAQRRAVYKQVLKETGDEMQALLQANNVIDFLKHGSGRAAQATVRTVAFMNAYAQSMDVMAQAMAGGGLKGRERKQVFAQFVKTGMVLASLSLLYSFAIGDDEEYQKMDDQTKVRNFIIPKSMTKYIGMDNSIKVPMHTSASFFFKSVPELIYNKIMNEGTKNQIDNQRLRTALKEAATDALLGPNVTPTGVKPFLEIALNKNFFTGGTVTPKGMENLEAFRQYTANTSELGKVISKGTFGLLNPIEADHLMKGLLGTVGAAAMWGSNMFSGDRAESNASANPFYGAFVSAPVPRGPEDVYYDLKERSTKVHNTFVDMMKKGRTEQAKEYRKENELLFKAYGYTNGVEQGLKQLNAEIRRISDLPGDKLSPAEKRERITYYQQKKNDILKDVIEYRKRAGL
jgi:hypothetical protein